MSKSKNEELKAMFNMMNKLHHGFLARMKVGNMAKVVKYNKNTHTADIQPLAKSSDGQTPAQLLDVPVSENCYIIDEILDRLKPELSKVDSHIGSSIVAKFPNKHLMRPGVPVAYVTLDRDTDNWERGRKANIYMPNTSRLHDINDSVIIGVFGGDAKDG